MKQIPLTRGKFAIVDDEDFDWLSQWKWYARKSRNTFYAERHISRENDKRITIRMHREVCGTPPRMETDHRDGDGLNNCRSNLRVATQSQNNANQRKLRSASSKYKGVWRDGVRRKWEARIRVNYRKIFLGYFEGEEEAAKAYDKAAQKFFGEFARLNFEGGLCLTG